MASFLRLGPTKTLDFIHTFAVCDGELLACLWCRYLAICDKKKQGPYIHLSFTTILVHQERELRILPVLVRQEQETHIYYNYHTLEMKPSYFTLILLR